MKTILLMFVMAFYSWPSKGQAQRPVSAKPTKQLTINYVVQKLNENCVGKFMKDSRFEYNFNSDLRVDYVSLQFNSVNIAKKYVIYEKGNDIILKLFMKREVEVIFENHPNENKFVEFTIEIPICKIKLISCEDINSIEEKKEQVKGKRITYSRNSFRAIIISTDGDYITADNIETGEIIHSTSVTLPSFNLEEEEEIKKSILHLQSFCKKTIDPFGN